MDEQEKIEKSVYEKYTSMAYSSLYEQITKDVSRMREIQAMERDQGMYYIYSDGNLPSNSPIPSPPPVKKELEKETKNSINEYMLSEKEIEEAIYTSKDIFIKKLNYLPNIKGTDKVSFFIIKNNKKSIINGLLQGIIYRGKVIDIRDIKDTDVFTEPYQLIYAYKRDNKNKFVRSSDIIPKGNTYGDPIESIPSIYSIKIIDAELSSAVFGLKPTKESLVGAEYSNYTIERGTHSKLNQETYYVTVPYKNRNIKFCLKDIEFIRPNLKGYNFPKNRNITEGSTVRLKRDDSRTKLIVMGVLTDKYRKSNNIIHVYDTMSNKEFKVYQKDLKLVC